jgi:hypothetical protein
MRGIVTVLAAGLIAALAFSPTSLHAGPGIKKIVPPPAAAPAGHVGALPWALMACPASIVLSGAVANFKDNRQLTYWEAVTCGLAYWFPFFFPVQTVATKPHH